MVVPQLKYSETLHHGLPNKALGKPYIVVSQIKQWESFTSWVVEFNIRESFTSWLPNEYLRRLHIVVS